MVQLSCQRSTSAIITCFNRGVQEEALICRTLIHVVIRQLPGAPGQHNRFPEHWVILAISSQSTDSMLFLSNWKHLARQDIPDDEALPTSSHAYLLSFPPTLRSHHKYLCHHTALLSSRYGPQAPLAIFVPIAFQYHLPWCRTMSRLPFYQYRIRQHVMFASPSPYIRMSEPTRLPSTHSLQIQAPAACHPEECKFHDNYHITQKTGNRLLPLCPVRIWVTMGPVLPASSPLSNLEIRPTPSGYVPTENNHSDMSDCHRVPSLSSFMI